MQAKALVEQAYNASGGLPVYLMGHSNGPLYLLALMNTTTPEWRQQYVGAPPWGCFGDDWQGTPIFEVTPSNLPNPHPGAHSSSACRRHGNRASGGCRLAVGRTSLRCRDALRTAVQDVQAARQLTAACACAASIGVGDWVGQGHNLPEIFTHASL